jgi:PAS domain S-box-containing protein
MPIRIKLFFIMFLSAVLPVMVFILATPGLTHISLLKNTSFPVLVLMVMISITILSFFVSLSITLPISELLGIIKQFQLGNLSQRINTGLFKGEMLYIANSFNKMADNIESSKMDIERERGRAESLLASIGEGIVALDKDLCVIFINDEAEKLLGLKEKSVIGCRWFEAFTIEDENGNSLPIKLNSVTSELSEVRFISGKKNRFPASLVSSPINFDNEITGIIFTFKDMSKLKELDVKKDRFIATLSHELRNPLSTILLNLQLLQSDLETLAPKAQKKRMIEPVDIAIHQSRHMSYLLNDLLDFNRILNDRIILKKEKTNLMNIIRKSIDQTRLFIEHGNHLVSVHVEGDSRLIFADPTRLEQIMANLISNAAKYGKDKSKIWISTKKMGSSIQITVKDEGIGIEADMLPKIFEMFNQGKNIGKKPGLGIGLTLVKYLTELHGGTITVKSEGKDKGSEFVLTLPANYEHSENNNTEALATAARFKYSNENKGNKDKNKENGEVSKILVVDDVKDAADTLAKLLKLSLSKNYDIKTAYSGEEALEIIRSSFKPNYILLDIEMTPNMDGYKTARLIRENKSLSDTVIIAVTGYGQHSDKQKAKEAGIDHHYTKPIDVKSLSKVIDSYA